MLDITSYSLMSPYEYLSFQTIPNIKDLGTILL